MATVTGFTAERMQEIEDSTVVDGEIVGDDLILVRRDSEQINAGNVRGPVGPTSGSEDIVWVPALTGWTSTLVSASAVRVNRMIIAQAVFSIDGPEAGQDLILSPLPDTVTGAFLALGWFALGDETFATPPIVGTLFSFNANSAMALGHDGAIVDSAAGGETATFGFSYVAAP